MQATSASTLPVLKTRWKCTHKIIDTGTDYSDLCSIYN